jgi:hypothetical protein
MKFLGVLLGVMVPFACSGDPGDRLAASDGISGTAGGASAGANDETTSDGLAAGAAADPMSPLAVLRGDRDRPTGPAVRHALERGAARLAALQADTIGDSARNGLVDADPDDGGWDFTLPAAAISHTATASPTNLFGETALGAWGAVESGAAGNRALVTALDAGLGLQRDPDIDSPPDFIFGVLLAELAENPGFAAAARQHYDAKRAGFGGAVGLGTFIRDARHARREDGLIAYDLGWLTLSAAALDAVFPGAGYDADADRYAGIVVDDLNAASPRFDLRDPGEAFYVIGLAWSQIAADRVGSVAVLRQVRNQLLAQQRGDGAWGTNSAQPAVDLQSTALALETLALTDRAAPATRQAERRASRFLIRAQAASGGWPDASGIELPLVDAEIMLGLVLSRTEVGEDGLVPDSPFEAGPATLGPAAIAPGGQVAAVASPMP